MKLSKICTGGKVHSPQSIVDGRQATIHSRWSTVDRPRSTADYRLSTIGYGLSTMDYRLWTIVWGLIFLLVSVSGCANINYSFTGAAISPEVKSISIQNFYNDSGGGPPVMSQQFTESLKDYYQQNTNLALVDEDGDLQLEGAIVRYDFEPVAPQSSGSDQVADVAAEMRLTITVEATYINTYDDQYDFDGKAFSFFADFPADQDPTAVEDELVEEILDQIIFDIFTATVANW